MRSRNSKLGKGSVIALVCSVRQKNTIFTEGSFAIIHEYGHYLDYKAFYDISQQGRFSPIVQTYRENFKGNNRKYYCNKREIFARAFEKYVWLKHGIGEGKKMGGMGLHAVQRN